MNTIIYSLCIIVASQHHHLCFLLHNATMSLSHNCIYCLCQHIASGFYSLASLSLFIQGLVPDAEEELELIAMNTQLLKSVPAKDDLFYIDEYQRPGMT